MSNDGLKAALAKTPVAGSDIDAVLDVMTAIDGALDEADGIACFNRLYRQTTLNVQAAAKAGRFRDVGFISRLDVVFANLYFGALARLVADPSTAPPAWRPLFEARARADVLSMQFAVAGMNAHINRDLAVAMSQVAAEQGGYPPPGSAQSDDYLAINQVLAEEEKKVKVWFENRALRAIDKELGRADDILAIWAIVEARQAAWRAGGVLFHFSAGGHPVLYDDTIAVLDRCAEMGSRGLLLAP